MFYYFLIQVLDLSRNQLNGVEENFAVKLQNINDVRLENNPLICDRCHMGPLIDKAENVRIFFLFFFFLVTNILLFVYFF